MAKSIVSIKSSSDVAPVSTRRRVAEVRTVGMNVREARIAEGLSIAEFADLLESTPVNVVRIELHAGDMKVSMLIRIAQALEVEPTDLLRGVQGK